jgi:hypothetical protein
MLLELLLWGVAVGGRFGGGRAVFQVEVFALRRLRSEIEAPGPQAIRLST